MSDGSYLADKVSRCRECGAQLMAGYLCDACDTVEVVEP